jgi:alpha-glucosidase
MRASVDELEAALPPFAQPNYVLGSHDKPRLATRFGPKNARSVAMLLLTLRGTPTLYNGDEIGMEEGKIPSHMIQDPQGLNLGAERSRDGCRTPMQWDSTPHAGFSTVSPWLPVSDDYPTRNVAVQIADPKSILSLYKRLLWYRRESAALNSGSYTPFDGVNGSYVYLREYGDERVLVAINFTDQPKVVNLPQPGRIVISTRLDREEAVGEDVYLNANEGVIIELSQ